MAVLPESMDRLGPDAGENFRVIEQYIRYLSERLEFSMSSLGRTVNSAGVSAAEVVLELRQLQNDLATVQSALGTLTGDVNGLKTAAADLAGRAEALETARTALEARVAALEQKGSET